MSMIGFPLLLIPLAIYNIVVFLMQGVSFETPLARIALVSGKSWVATFSDGLLALAMLLLIFEMIRASRPGAKYFTDHLLSLLVFGAAGAEFVLLPQFATSTFFLLTALTLVDFLASIGVRSRRAVQAKPRTGKQRRAEEPAFVPSAASDLARPTESEVRVAPVQQLPPTDAAKEPVPPMTPLNPEGHATDDPKRDPAVINPQR